jgi:pyruvate/2-oxoglutarate dehydrogenase complex dihydrolipoamide acyltransferase (E2) component
MLAAVFGLAGALVGAIIAVLGTYGRDRASASAEARARQYEAGGAFLTASWAGAYNDIYLRHTAHQDFNDLLPLVYESRSQENVALARIYLVAEPRLVAAAQKLRLAEDELFKAISSDNRAAARAEASWRRLKQAQGEARAHLVDVARDIAKQERIDYADLRKES